MTHDDPTNDILPVDENLTRDTFAELCQRINQLKHSILRAADYSAMLGFPEPETTKRITSAIIDLIAATAEATHKLQHHQQRRKAATAAKPASSEHQHHEPQQHYKPHQQLGTPTTNQTEDQAQS